MYYKSAIKRLLKKVSSRGLTVAQAYDMLRELPYKDLGFAKLDNHRVLRRGFPEAIYCEGKTPEQLEGIVAALIDKNRMLILTRAGEKLYKRLKKRFSGLKFNKTARMIYRGRAKPRGSGKTLIITGGTADGPVAEEAKLTLELMGNRVSTLYDAGVAGLHRLMDRRMMLSRANVIIVISGMEGALASVVSGLTAVPVIAVPTSAGYGANFKGMAALLAMLSSCSPGVGVVNIDNGFGAGYLAGLINKHNRI